MMTTTSFPHGTTFYDALACGILLLNERGEIVEANAAAQRLLSIRPERVQGQFVSLAHRGPVVDAQGQPMPLEERPAPRVLRTGQPVHGVVMGLIRHDGTPCWLQVDAVPLRDEEERLSVLMSFVDITAHKETAEMLRAVTENAHDAIITADADGRIHSWNAAATCLFGYTVEEAIGQPLTLIIPERYRAAHEHGLAARAPAQALGRMLTLTGCRKDGSEIPIELSLSSWVTADGHFYSAIIRDITTREQAAAARWQAEERLRAVVDNAPLMLFAIDRDGIIQLAEGKGLQRRGRTSGDYVGRSLFEVHADHPAVLDGARHALGGEAAVTTSDQAGVAFETRYVPLRNATGAVTGAIGVSTDVTERVRAEEALRQSEERFRALTEHGSDLVSILAPDGTVRYESPSHQRILGAPLTEVQHRAGGARCHPPGRLGGNSGGVRRLSGRGCPLRGGHLPASPCRRVMAHPGVRSEQRAGQPGHRRLRADQPRRDGAYRSGQGAAPERGALPRPARSGA